MGMASVRTILSQGEVRPGVVQGQYWREDHPRIWREYIDGPDGEKIEVSTLGGRQPPPTFGVTSLKTL
jgi:hypothetical protein